MKMKIGLVTTSVLLLGASFAYAGSANITGSEYGDKWPLTVAGGTLSCTPIMIGNLNLSIVTFTSNGKTYAVNGTAIGRAKKNGWGRIDEIWKADPSTPGLKINIGPVLDKGLSLCK